MAGTGSAASKGNLGILHKLTFHSVLALFLPQAINLVVSDIQTLSSKIPVSLWDPSRGLFAESTQCSP